MSTGSASIPLLKAAPEADQVAERLAGGPWAGPRAVLMPGDVRDDDVHAARRRRRAPRRRRVRRRGWRLTAEAPVAWPSGAFVRVDRLDDEARDGIERSARVRGARSARPCSRSTSSSRMTPGRSSARPAASTSLPSRRSCASSPTPAASAGSIPLHRERPARPADAHRRRLPLPDRRPLARPARRGAARVPELGFTLDTSHAALFRYVRGALPVALRACEGDEGLELGALRRGARARRARSRTSPTRTALLGEGLPYGAGELDLDPVVAPHRRAGAVRRRRDQRARPARSPDMKAGYRADRAGAAHRRRARGAAAAPHPGRALRLADGRSAARPRARRARAAGGASAAAACSSPAAAARSAASLTTLLEAFRPAAASRCSTRTRRRSPPTAARATPRTLDALRSTCSATSATAAAWRRSSPRASPDVVFHLAAYKHVDWAESYPEEFVDTNLHGSWNVLRAAEAAGVETVVVASTDKAALATQLLRPDEAVHGAADRASPRGAPAPRRAAVRLVNVLGSGGSASELFLRQARAGVPLTVTDTGMLRYWITMAHAAALVAHVALLPGDGCC